MSGFGPRASERQVLVVGWAAAMAIVSLITFLDIVTQAHGEGPDALARTLVSQLSSWLTMTLAICVPAAVALWLRRRRPAWWQAALVHAVALPIYFLIHAGGFLVLRKLAYPLLLGAAYETGPLVVGVFYEASKDVPAYAFGVTAFWLVLRWFAGHEPTAQGGPDLFDIRDGARLVRAPVAEILAVRSAGNYVEFLLDDGRRPLMRGALGALETQLAPRGFVRTHRSWLINQARVTGLRPEGSGDYAVELGAVQAPLSRRFREALKALRT